MIGYYRIRSPLALREDGFIAALQAELGEEMRETSLNEYLEAEFRLLYVASGGSEGYFLEVFDALKAQHLYILTSGDSNSLAASMEILSYINKHGGSGEIIHGSIGDVAKKLRRLKRAHAALSGLKGKALGLIGESSDWLIASSYDADKVRQKTGLGFVKIDMAELLSEIASGGYEENEYTRALKQKPFKAEETEKALSVYGAFDRIVKRYKLAGVSVRCFDLLDSVFTTGCLGLAILNSLGVYGGCEGDMPSLLSMAILGSVTGEHVFMCNPCRFDIAEKSAVFAHCTAPLDILEKYELNTHFESDIGVAIQGVFAPGDMTVFKCEGDLSRFHVQQGALESMPFSDKLCRTQIKLRLEDIDYFLTNPINNHHIVCRGAHAEDIKAFFRLL